MIISNDMKSVWLAPPKAGTISIKNVLKPYGIPLTKFGIHPTPEFVVDNIMNEYPHINPDELNYYVFWRNPVDRFISMANFFKRHPLGLMQMFPERFINNPLPLINGKKRYGDIEFSMLSKKQLDIIQSISMEDIIIGSQNILSNKLFTPTYRWATMPNTTIMNFHDFENEVKRLVNIFGGNGEEVVIPHMNGTILDAPTLTPQEIQLITAYYWEDFGLDPSLE